MVNFRYVRVFDLDIRREKLLSNFNGSNIFGTFKFVRDMGSSSHRGLTMAPGQEANGDDLVNAFQFSTQ